MEEEEVTYQKEVRNRSKEIRKMEKEGLKLHRQRKRDVARFRGHLVELTSKLDELTSLHGGHSRALLRDSQETSVKIVEATSSLVRAEVDIFESLARKGWSGGGLDELLDKGVDLFANEAEVGDDDATKLFAIPAPKSILTEAGADKNGDNRDGGSQVDGEQYQSLAGAVSARDRDETGSIFSQRTGMEGNFNKPRGVRPFSPPPPVTRRRDTDGAHVVSPLEENNDPIQSLAGALDVAAVLEETQIEPVKEDTTVEQAEVEDDAQKNEDLPGGRVSNAEVVPKPQEATSPPAKRPDRGRERRWSVTEDALSALSE
jgi:hypothetical protein